MTCLMHSFADGWVVLLQAQQAQLHSCTSQLAELHSVVESKQGEIDKLGQCLTASQQKVEALQQQKDSAVEAHSATSQVGNISVSCLGVVMQLHKSIQQLISWLICLTVPCHYAITVLNIQQGAGL